MCDISQGRTTRYIQDRWYDRLDM